MAKVEKVEGVKAPTIKKVKHEMDCFNSYPVKPTVKCRTCKFHVDCKKGSKK